MPARTANTCSRSRTRSRGTFDAGASRIVISEEIAAVLSAWSIAPRELEPVGSGYINDTYRVDRRYVLQRINPYVFDDAAQVVVNHARLIDAARAATDAPPLVGLIATDAGQPYARDANGDVWRLAPWLDGRSYDDLPDGLVFAAARAFGWFGRFFTDRFARATADLTPTITGFHDLATYLERWDAARGPAGLAAESSRIDSLRRHFAPGHRDAVIHGDCKVNNLLFHRHRDTVVAILDLDTAMRGDAAWDFGDLARSVATGSPREEAAWNTRLTSLCNGYVAGFGHVDATHFAAAPAYMSFMLAVRFLTDHLEDDVYFKVQAHGDNLVRGRAQLDAAERFLGVRETLAELLEQARAPDAPTS